ncbi:DUF433 domain-containing protein [Pimelobacter simplex]|uniref:DUF433 domain-containing protein n=1 Tax=Nocardioides simplex TaxID=2045 RepID=UPI0036712852
MPAEEHLMLRRDTVARLAGVSERRIDYWEKTELVAPTVEVALTASRTTRLYDFRAAMTIMVLASLREHVSLQHVRQIVAHLKMLEFSVPEVKFALAGERVHFQLADGTWSGIDDPGQVVLHEVLDLQPLRSRLLSSHRPAEAQGQVERRRGVRGSKPVIAGTRVPISAVRSYLDDGAEEDEILAAYPSLTSADVAAVRTLASA